MLKLSATAYFVPAFQPPLSSFLLWHATLQLKSNFTQAHRGAEGASVYLDICKGPELSLRYLSSCRHLMRSDLLIQWRLWDFDANGGGKGHQFNRRGGEFWSDLPELFGIPQLHIYSSIMRRWMSVKNWHDSNAEESLSYLKDLP